MRSFFNKYRFWFQCQGIVFGVLCLVYSFYLACFFLGNHEWPFLRYGVPVNRGVWEARITQYIPQYVFFHGQILPIFSAISGFFFLSGASVLLAFWFRIKQRFILVLLFCFLIVLHPYHVSQFYYMHTLITIGLWHFLSVVGVMCCWQTAVSKKYQYAILGFSLLIFVLLGYVACLELILTVLLSKFIVEIAVCKKVNSSFLRPLMCVGMIIFCVMLSYAGLIEILKVFNIISRNMYNTQTLSFYDTVLMFISNLTMPFHVIMRSMAYVPRIANYLEILLVIVAGLTVIFTCERYKRICMILAFIALLYAMLVCAYISPYYIFYLFRVHSFSVPYVIAFMFLFIVLYADKIVKNNILVLSAFLLMLFVKADFNTQKVWYMGHLIDDRRVERIKKDILPQLDMTQHYRISVIGDLRGNFKAANKKIVNLGSAEDYREYWGGSYFLSIFFSSGLFAYESFNPIWGDVLYLGDMVSYAINNENIEPVKKIDAMIFSTRFGSDKKEMLTAIRQLKPFPQYPYYYIGEKDIVLMLSEDENIKDVLIAAITNEVQY